MMQLFYSPASPFVRKVRVVLQESGQTDAVSMVATTGGPLDTAEMPLAQNPLGKIPTLVRPDGPALYDSRVICRYLDDRFELGFYPEAQIWDVLTLEATADGILDAAVLMVYETRWRPEGMVYAPWVEAQWDKVARALDAIEQRWMAHLAGKLDMAHIALGCALGYLDFRHGDRDWRIERPALSGWFTELAERDGMKLTAPEG